MISIIICSKDLYLYNKVRESIEETIGTIVYEIIKIDNSVEHLAITKAYNIGIHRAKYDYLLFIHEDILFHTVNWGNILLSIFRDDSQIGLIGIAGTKYKSQFPSAFWHTEEEMLNINLIQHYENKKPSQFRLGFKNGNIEKVVAIDGVFISLRKSSGVNFNEHIEGFHCYDLGISVDVIEKKMGIVVTDQILIEHFSIGNANLDFVRGVINFHKLYKEKLPKYIEEKNVSLEYFALKRFLEVCLDNRFITFKFWFIYLIKKPFTRLNFNLLKLVLHKVRKSKLK